VTEPVGIRGVGYAFPAAHPSVRELAAQGRVASDPGLLEGFGFQRVHAALDETPWELACQAARQALDEAGWTASSVELLVYGGVGGATAFVSAPSEQESWASHRTTARFRYPGPRLQHELGLDRAQVLGVDQLACTTLFGAVRVARALCLAEGLGRALCVVADFFPRDAGREAVFNCTSDAAVAVLVERGTALNRILSHVQVTHGLYWDADALRSEMLSAYFPVAKDVIAKTVAGAGWRAEEVDWVLPHNVASRSWRILSALAGLGGARLWTENLARDGHTLAGDNFINLADARASGRVRPGEKLLLFSFGYGAHWTGMALEA